MDEAMTIRNERLANKLINALKRRHYEAYYCENQSALLQQAGKLIPEGSSVTWGGSLTIRSTGLTEMLKKGNYQVYDRDAVTDPQEKLKIYRKAFECDYYLSSVNAMTEDGVIVNIDGNGNRVAALCWGPTHVLLVVGLNKICSDLDSAVKRARHTAAPINMSRFNYKTPCQMDGICHDCLSKDSICNYMAIQRLSHPAGRHIVLLVGESLGY
nr:lactate utilization protein [uncultured Prevotella sp.]